MRRLLLFIACCGFIALLASQTASAHLATDLYHTTNFTFSASDIKLSYGISPDPIIMDDWLKILDTNKNQVIEQTEAQAFINKYITPIIKAKLNNKTIHPTQASIQIAPKERYYSGDDVITIQYVFENLNLEENNIFTVDITPKTGDFQYETVFFNDNLKEVKDLKNATQESNFDNGNVYTAKFSRDIKVVETPKPTPANIFNYSQFQVQDIIRSFDPNNPTYLVTALVLVFFAGFIHSLTPGHGKSIITAYLIGTQRKKYKDILILGTSITVSHTILIFILGFFLLAFSQLFTVNSILPFFTVATAFIMTYLGLSLLRQSYRTYTNKNPNAHDHGFLEHEHKLDQQLIKRRSEKQQFGTMQLFFIGLSGGLIPCVEALSLLIFAAKAGYTLFGLIMVLSFSVGLASAIILIGLLITRGKQNLSFLEKYSRLFQIMVPLVIGLLVIGYAIYSGATVFKII